MSSQTIWMTSRLYVLSALGIWGAARGELIRWDNPAGGDYGVASNWNPNRIPGSSDDPLFNLAANFSVAVDQSYTANSVQVRDGEVTFDLAGFTLDILGGVLIGDSSQGNPALRVTNGELTGKYGRVAMETGSAGAISVTGQGSKWTIGSTLEVGAGGQGMLLIAAGGEVTSDNGVIGASSDSTGEVTVTGTGSRWTMGFLGVGGGGTSSGTGSLFIDDGGRVDSANAEVATVSGTQTTTGVATIRGLGSKWTIGASGRGFLILGGSRAHGSVIIGPGAHVEVGLRYTQHPNATLRFELADADPTAGYGVLEAINNVTLDGILEITLTDGFVPNPDDAFTILRFSSRTSYFANAIPEGGVATLVTEQGIFELRYNTDSVVLSNFRPK